MRSPFSVSTARITKIVRHICVHLFTNVIQNIIEERDMVDWPKERSSKLSRSGYQHIGSVTLPLFLWTIKGGRESRRGTLSCFPLLQKNKERWVHILLLAAGVSTGVRVYSRCSCVFARSTRKQSLVVL
jgi:hypothetical protein